MYDMMEFGASCFDKLAQLMNDPIVTSLIGNSHCNLETSQNFSNRFKAEIILFQVESAYAAVTSMLCDDTAPKILKMRGSDLDTTYFDPEQYQIRKFYLDKLISTVMLLPGREPCWPLSRLAAGWPTREMIEAESSSAKFIYENRFNNFNI